jgi:hypothetical protein
MAPKRTTLQQLALMILVGGMFAVIFSSAIQSPAGPDGKLTTDQRIQRGVSAVMGIVCILTSGVLLLVDRDRKRRGKDEPQRMTPAAKNRPVSSPPASASTAGKADKAEKGKFDWDVK